MAEEETFNNLATAIVQGDVNGAVALAERVVAEGMDPLAAIEQGLRPGITEVGDGFACQEMFLPDLVVAADAMKAASDVLNKEIQRRGLEQVALGKIVLGTVSGDLHDIGKTIAGTLLAANGFDVVDLGVDISTERFVRAVQEEQPAVLGMSSLLTTTAKELARVIEALKEAGIRDSVQVIVGGGAVTEEYAESIGADGYGQDAELGVRTVKKMLSVSD